MSPSPAEVPGPAAPIGSPELASPGEVVKIAIKPARVAHRSARTKARKAALDVLFEADLRGRPVLDSLDQAMAQGDVRPYTIQLVRGVAEHAPEIDARIAALLPKGWTLQRMPTVDRALARIAVFEILHTDTPDVASVADTVALAEELSTDESAAFLNGLLAKLVSSGSPT